MSSLKSAFFRIILSAVLAVGLLPAAAFAEISSGGISVDSVDELKRALQSDAIQTIRIDKDIDFVGDPCDVKADHTIVISEDCTLTLPGYSSGVYGNLMFPEKEGDPRILTISGSGTLAASKLAFSGPGSIYLVQGIKAHAPAGVFSDYGKEFSPDEAVAVRQTGSPTEEDQLTTGFYNWNETLGLYLRGTYSGKDPNAGVGDLNDLKAALAAGGVVKLGANYALDEPLTVEKAVELQLNGFELSASNSWNGSAIVVVRSGGDLTVSGEGTIDGSSASYAIWAEAPASGATTKLTANGGTHLGGSAAIAGAENSVIVVNDGTFSSDVSAYLPAGLACKKDPVSGLYVVDNPSLVRDETALLSALANDIFPTVTVKESIQLTRPVVINREVALVIEKGCRVTASGSWSGSSLFTVSRGASLVVSGEGVIDGLVGNGALVPVGVQMVGDSEPASGDSAKLTVGGGVTFQNFTTAVSGSKDHDGTEITLGKCSLISPENAGGAAVFHPQDGKLVVSDGAFLRGDTAVYLCDGSLTISGGNIAGWGAKSSYVATGDGFAPTGDAVVIDNRNTGSESGYGTPEASISGGGFDGIKTGTSSVASYTRDGAQGGTLSKFITGGAFSDEFPESYAAEGYERVRNAGGGWGVKVKDHMLVNGEVVYKTPAEVLSGSEASYDVKLMSDFYFNGPLVIDKKVSLDLNGYMIAPSGNWISGDTLIVVASGGDLTVADSADGGQITNMEATQVIHQAIKVAGSGKLSVEDGLIQGYYYGIAGVAGDAGSQIVINGGEVRSYADGGVGVYHPQNGKLSISGGLFRGTSSVWFGGGNLNVTGGTFYGSSWGREYDPSADEADIYGTGDALVIERRGVALSAEVSGGTFSGPLGIIPAGAVGSYAHSDATSDALKGFLVGGSYISDVTALVHSGCVCYKEGSFYVVRARQISSAADPKITIPVSAAGNTVRIDATINGSSATVDDISQEELDSVADGSENHDVTIDFSELDGDITEVVLSADSLVRISDVAKEANGVNGLDIKLTGGWGVRFDADALEAIAAATGGSGDVSVKLEENDGTSLTDEQNDVLGQMGETTVVSAIVTVDSGNVSDFQGGYVKVSVPYEVPKNGKYKFTTAWYISEDGKKEPITTTYDEARKMVCFYVPHFSDYAITSDEANFAHVCPSAALADVVEGAWYHEAVDFVVLENIMGQGTGGRFAPGATTTRAQFVTALWRYAGSPVAEGAEAPAFADVAEGAYYAKAVAWAVESGITTGYTEGPSAGRFGVADPVTREQMATFLWRFAKAQGVDVSTAVDLSIFVDAGQVGSYAGPAFEWAVANGVIGGYTDGSGRLGPKDDATRAQVATVLYRFDNLA